MHTDGSAAYRTLRELGYLHQRTVMLGSDIAAHVSMPGVHRVAALLKRWILGTHHGAVQPAHLDAYLDEFVFRFNEFWIVAQLLPWMGAGADSSGSAQGSGRHGAARGGQRTIDVRASTSAAHSSSVPIEMRRNWSMRGCLKCRTRMARSRSAAAMAAPSWPG